MYVNDQAIGIGQQKRGVIADVIDVEHHPGHVSLVLGDPDLSQETIRYIKALAHQCRRQFGLVKVKENPVGDWERARLRT